MGYSSEFDTIQNV